MKKGILGILFILASILLTGCMSGSSLQSVMYDLGPTEEIPQDVAIPDSMPFISVSKVASADWLNSSMMYYRLGHINDKQTRIYSESRWNGQPAKIVRDRIRTKIIEARNKIKKFQKNEAQLQIVLYIEDFSQYFYNETESEGRVSIRATLLCDGEKIAQKIFMQAEPAPSADAAGGVKALSVATDNVISEILVWIIKTYQR